MQPAALSNRQLFRGSAAQFPFLHFRLAPVCPEIGPAAQAYPSSSRLHAQRGSSSATALLLSLSRSERTLLRPRAYIRNLQCVEHIGTYMCMCARVHTCICYAGVPVHTVFCVHEDRRGVYSVCIRSACLRLVTINHYPRGCHPSKSSSAGSAWSP